MTCFFFENLRFDGDYIFHQFRGTGDGFGLYANLVAFYGQIAGFRGAAEIVFVTIGSYHVSREIAAGVCFTLFLSLI